MRTILDHALSSEDSEDSEDSEARQLAIEVIHRLGAQGEDYRDVLEQALHTPTSGGL